MGIKYTLIVKVIIINMKDYFFNQKEYLKGKYEINNFQEELFNIELDNILGFEVDEDIKNIYKHYKKFNITWFENAGKYIGEINFIPYHKLEIEHNNLIDIMDACYDVELDEFGIVKDIIKWYPLFLFSNGDAFCLNIENGRVVFFEHEVFDTGKNLHGLIIALSINDLFEKWEKIHFADVYYWDELCNDGGINLESDLAKKYK